MLDLIEQCVTEYRKTIRDLAETSSLYATLHEFVNVKRHPCQAPATVALLTISPKIQNESPGSAAMFKNVCGLAELSRELASLPSNNECCQLFVVENMCPQSIALIGGVLNVSPEIFARHLRDTTWHRVDEISDRVPLLPSITNSRQFNQLVYMEVQRTTKQPFVLSGKGYSDRSLVPSPGQIVPGSRFSGARFHVEADEMSCRVPRKARKLRPWIRKGRKFESLVSARQITTIWFRGESQNTWTGRNVLKSPS
jgi:hypothetical protein